MRKFAIIYTSLVIISLLLTVSMTANNTINPINKINKNNKATLLIDDVLDQKQELHNRESPIRSGLLVAQEFKPSKTPLTKVILKIRKTLIIQEPLIVSIRKKLNDVDLTVLPLLGSQIPFNTFWVEFDFKDIEVDVNETYYIVARSTASQSFWWQTQLNQSKQGDPYNRGKLWQSNDNGINWESLDSGNYFFDCTFKTYTYNSKPDLQCNGSLSWTNVTPKSKVTGSFTVENVGTPLSYLNWKIYLWPSWGTWTFSQSSGTNLKPEDGPVTIQVTVEAPNITNSQYSGKIKIINLDDEDDFCIINCVLSTPRTRNTHSSQLVKFFENIFQFIENYDTSLFSKYFMRNLC